MFPKEVSWDPPYLSSTQVTLWSPFSLGPSICTLADDTTIYCIGKSIDEVAAALNQSLTEPYPWCLRNKLIPHPKKSEYILIHRGSFAGPHPPIYLGDNILERVTHSRLLGVDIDGNLGWSTHTKGLKKSFVNKLSLMKKSRF